MKRLRNPFPATFSTGKDAEDRPGPEAAGGLPGGCRETRLKLT